MIHSGHLIILAIILSKSNHHIVIVPRLFRQSALFVFYSGDAADDSLMVNISTVNLLNYFKIY